MSVIDLSLTIDNECMTCNAPWHVKASIEPLGYLKEVGRNTSQIRLGSHTATHMDAPLHFFDDGYGIEKIELEQCVGPVTCVDLTNKKARDIVTLEDLQGIVVSERMLFVFGWCKWWKTEQYYKGFPYFSPDAIDYLLEQGMKFMAMDTPSPDDGSAIRLKDDSPMHKILLSRNVIIVEYLCSTEKIDYSKKYEIFALPLKLSGADGSPARVILREIL